MYVSTYNDLTDGGLAKHLSGRREYDAAMLQNASMMNLNICPLSHVRLWRIRKTT